MADSKRLALLSNAGLALVSTFDYSKSLQEVAELTLGLLCDYCIFDIFEDDGPAVRVAWAHSNPNWPRLPEIGKFAPPTRIAKYPVSQVIKTGKPVFVPYVTDEWMQAISWSDEHLELMRALSPSSAMFVPLTAHGSTVGGAIFAFSDSLRHHTEADLDLALDLGRRAGLAVLHSRQYEALQANALRLRQLTQHQQFLIGELNHRVKNTLAIVQAMAGQTLRASATPESGWDAFTSRIASLSRAHDLLTRDNWEGADLADIVEGTAKAHQNEGEERFRVRGDSLHIAPRIAFAITMTLHELATNATKYGALSNETGHVEIGWRVFDDKPRALLLWWQETGGPEATPPTQRGFGSRLIEGQLGRDSVTVTYPSTGLICRIKVPLD